ncbi:MAG TPA: VanZ family protein [Gammaproteobacteria bacterium]|nr:VanZ family protein [Gammaproteobacteria bacterium]
MTHLILAGWFLQIYHGKRQWILVSIACLAFGGAIELLQMLTPARAAEWLDLGADAVGVGLASGIAFSRGKYLLEAVENRLLNSNWKTA